ncbi:hypothetical protein GQ44DRAFT_722719 [Phaeosphaeriaceae sp. PMI808]|nr:hypothetical protein GQ44DRAFT_722719 [Phaeosphaeriaceae sp. PMI808]
MADAISSKKRWTSATLTYTTTELSYTIFLIAEPITVRLLPTQAGGIFLLPSATALIPDGDAQQVDGVLYTAQFDPLILYWIEGDGIVTLPQSTATASRDQQVTSVLQRPSTLKLIVRTSTITTTPSVASNGGFITPSELGDNSSEAAPKSRKNAIIGGIVGSILVLFLLVVALVFWRHKKKAKTDATNQNATTLLKRQSSKMVIDPDDLTHDNSTYYANYITPVGADQIQEMDPMTDAHELKADTNTGDLPQHQSDESWLVSASGDHSRVDNTVDVVDEPSPHVEAQMAREVEWLEMEEAKLRQRRENLIRQSIDRSLRHQSMQ